MTDLFEAELAGRLDQAFAVPSLRGASVSVLVREVDSGRVVYALDPDRRLTPASVTKLYTAHFALDILGPAHRFSTRALSSAVPGRDGRLDGDLVVVGDGDPALDLAGVAELARQTAHAGLRRLRGRVLADATAFPAEPFAPGWTLDGADLPGSAPPSALSVEQNCATLRLWPGGSPGDPVRWSVAPGDGIVTIENRAVTGPHGVGQSVDVARLPGTNRLLVDGILAAGHTGLSVRRNVFDAGLWSAGLFAQALRREGVELTGEVAHRTGELPAVPLAEHRSPSLDVLVARMNKPSDNFVAEQLYRAAGERAADADEPRAIRLGPGTAERRESRAARAQRASLRRAGVVESAADYRLDDGSGLSRYNLVSAAATLRLLLAALGTGFAPAFVASLPVAGVDGSLAGRLQGTPGAGSILAKTGSLGGVSTLAGYVAPGGTLRLAFAILVNGFVGDGAGARAAQDHACAALADYAAARTGVRFRA